MPTPRLPYPSSPTEYLQAPVGGWSPDIPTWEMPTNQAPLLENFQIRSGKIRVRPPYRTVASLGAITGPSLAGWLSTAPTQSLYMKRLYNTVNPVEPQNLHRTGTSIGSSQPTPVEQAMYLIQGATVTRATLGSPQNVPSGNQVLFNGHRYALGYSSTGFGDGMTYNDGVTSYTNHFMEIVSPTTTNLISGAPIGGFDVYTWLSRIFVAGGIDPSTLGVNGVPSTTALFYTLPLQTLTGYATDWQGATGTPQAGLYNQIDVDGDHSDAIVGLASVPLGLLIFRENSLFILRGTGPDSYVVRPVTRQSGCIDKRSICEQGSKVYFMSEQGLMVTDGTQAQNISGVMQDELYRQIQTWTTNVYGGTGAWCTIDSMTDDNLLITMGVYGAGSNTTNYPMIGTFSATFNPMTGAWVRVTTLNNPTGTSGTLGPAISGNGDLYTLGNQSVIAVEDHVAAITTSSPSSLYDTFNTSGGYQPIVAKWYTKSFQTGLAGRTRVQLEGAVLDYAVSTGGPAGQIQWTPIERMTGVTPANVPNMPIAVSQNSTDTRQYLQRDVFCEATDLQFQITLAGTNPTGGSLSVPKAEIHGLGIQFGSSFNMRPVV